MDQGELLPVEHRSLQKKRLRRHKKSDFYTSINAERIYAAEWLRLNRTRLSTGATYLEMILAPNCGPAIPFVSRRDAAVAASVVQWLGTNCGLGFVRSCERKIDQARRSEEEARRRPSLLALEREAAAEAAKAIKRGIALTGRLV